MASELLPMNDAVSVDATITDSMSRFPHRKTRRQEVAEELTGAMRGLGLEQYRRGKSRGLPVERVLPADPRAHHRAPNQKTRSRDQMLNESAAATRSYCGKVYRLDGPSLVIGTSFICQIFVKSQGQPLARRRPSGPLIGWVVGCGRIVVLAVLVLVRQREAGCAQPDHPES